MKLIREFDVEMGSTENLWYRIRVWHLGTLVEDILKPTMHEAEIELAYRGYKVQHE